ncbi:MAG: polyprenyl synthetase family protein [Saprospiraceae bacterium]|nr:MAG: geranyltranstransferase [Bacteroidetes bacterium OLB9]MCO6464846.1 polyprenyl synthetase family protein [Saprospiraceae bacterium]
MDLIAQLRVQFEDFLSKNPLTKDPVSLYEPADYILSIGGKRLRPVLTLLGTMLYGRHTQEAMKAAMAVEVFHNFSLVHDDVMDNADIRRGQPTVHKKYNINTSILTGDVMLVKAYQYILDYEDPELVYALMNAFNKMAFGVCEGQQLDMDFEKREDVNIQEYLHMITLKTSVLIGAAIQMGAIVARADKQDQFHIYEFGKNLGIAFQLQDDNLDVFGTQAQVGKRIGGDILQNKKTYLYLKALELCSDEQRAILENLYAETAESINEDFKIETVTQIFKDVYVVEYSRQVIEAYRDLAFSHLDACKIASEFKKQLKDFVNEFIFREQ